MTCDMGAMQGLVKSRGPRKIVNQCDLPGLDYRFGAARRGVALIVGSEPQESPDGIFMP